MDASVFVIGQVFNISNLFGQDEIPSHGTILNDAPVLSAIITVNKGSSQSGISGIQFDGTSGQTDTGQAHARFRFQIGR